ncbi:gamma-glutamyltransferase [Salmonella enterica subsp. enterica serovar Florida]|uniref:Glutathione hydrolase proenzyme n=1 Tax=Salmonella enterica subsp. enterica serovar Rough O:d:1,7 TaxID=1974323 RepID=A0A974KD79_SALET|nr:gamma-glutamyltransferase [Salmonella enterica subsp. enterica serovar Florida]ECF4168198.1 gamma-glutamyltransferase [Salmonella enterica subsp. enterica serovar Florida]ECW2475962.1 gamma-glutamyltransferase [Salmonella enterica subsp. enterica serovar Florida]OSD65468.1 gamma-glutamyltransferase [Salmonella enterica subsp. enterica serovar Rough O:d:1,7]
MRCSKIFFYISIFSSMLSTNTFAFDTIGKYCNTPSHCIDPMTKQVMVTTPNYLATQSALKVLHEGGNAIDAAIAAAATLSVVYPQMTTIGGDNFWLIYNAKTKEVRAINGSGRSGEQATINLYKNKGFNEIPPRGYLSANTVPGVISGWDLAYRYGKNKIGTKVTWSQLLESAINYASNGFVVTPSLAKWMKIDTFMGDGKYRDLQRFQGFKHTFLKENGTPYIAGEILKQPDLAKTLKTLSTEGAVSFYKGSIARQIVADLRHNGGILTLHDFATHKADWVTPIHVQYRGMTAYNLPPNTQGVASLEILNILNNFNVKKLGEGSADYYHLIIEATKEAFADRDKYLTDPAFSKIPLKFLLSRQHGIDQANRISMKAVEHNIKPLDPKGDTIWLGVMDKDGNAVSLNQSIYYDFGSAIVPKNTGVLLQNRGSFFSLDPENVNHLEPGKRTFHTLNPAMMLKNGKPVLLYGTMGGEGQPQTQAAIATRIIDFGMSPQEAINAPRWLYGRTWGAASNNVQVEGRIPESVTYELMKRGQSVKVVEDYTDTMGHAGAIWIDPVTGVRYGATDPRSDGLAAGY